MKNKEISMEDLHKSAFKVDFLPKKLSPGIMFQMGGYNFLHIGKQNCILVMYEDEHIELPIA